MARSAWQGPAVLGFALVVLQVSSLPAFAECGNLLAEVVKPGDVVSVTPWSGGKQTGQATAITDCSLVVRTPKGLLDMPFETIKTVSRHRRAASDDTKALLNVADDCREISCAHAALAFVGIAAAVRGFDRLVHPPKVVYRAKKRLPAATAFLASPSTSRADRRER
jgi:hypothetical protein